MATKPQTKVQQLSSVDVGIEVKATASPTTADLTGLRFLRDRLGDRFRFGFLLCLAPEALRMGDRLAVLPIDSLWTRSTS